MRRERNSIVRKLNHQQLLNQPVTQALPAAANLLLLALRASQRVRERVTARQLLPAARVKNPRNKQLLEYLMLYIPAEQSIADKLTVVSVAGSSTAVLIGNITELFVIQADGEK